MSFKCPICNDLVEQQFTGTMASFKYVSCKHFCFEEIENKFLTCPICKKGNMSLTTYHGTEYKKCDNKECGFELSVDKVITLALGDK